MAKRALPSANRTSTGGRLARAATGIGVAAFNKMFPTLGRVMDRVSGSRVDREETDSRMTRTTLNASFISNNDKFSAIVDSQNKQNQLLEQILAGLKRSPNNQASPILPGLGGGGGGAPGPEIPNLPDLERRERDRPQRQNPRSRSKWSKFMRFLRRRATSLYARIGYKLATAIGLASIPGFGWFGAVMQIVNTYSDAMTLYGFWQEFNSLSEAEQDSPEEDDNEDTQPPPPNPEETATRERQQEAARENLGDVSQMGDTQTPTPEEQPVLDASRQRSEERRDQAGLTENLEDPVRQEIMQRLARQRELAARPGQAGRAAARSIPQIEAELERHNARNPISQEDATRIRPQGNVGASMDEEMNAFRESEPYTGPRGSVGASMDEEMALVNQTPQNQTNIPTFELEVIGNRDNDETKTRVNVLEKNAEKEPESFSSIRFEGNTLVYDFDKIRFEAGLIKFDGVSSQPAASPVNRPSVAGSSPSPSPSISISGGGSSSSSGNNATPIVAGPASAPTGGGNATGNDTAGISAGPASAPTGGGNATGSDATRVSTSTSAGQPQATAERQMPQVTGTTAQILSTIRNKESGGNYQAQARGSSASGAYQFIDGTWQSLTRRFNIGTEFRRAVEAPPNVQDALAAAYVNDILSKNNNNVAVVPLVWYTGNAQGRMSTAALEANRGLTPDMYQQRWLADFARQGGSAPQTPVAQAPTTGQTMVQASTTRVVADREQVRNSQRIASSFNQQSAQTQQPSNVSAPAAAPVGEVPLRVRMLSTFNQLAQAS